MGLVLELLAIYALACIMITAIVVFYGFEAVVDSVPPGTRYDVFILNLIISLLISPITLPVAVVKVIRRLWQEIIEKCQSLDDDHQ